MLTFAPLKPHKMTEYIVIKTKNKNSAAFWYRMFDTSGQEVGKMKAYPETIFDTTRQFSPNADSYRSFYIDRLFSFFKDNGVGRAFINIAKKESLKEFCSGNVHVISTNRFDKDNPSHIFYRKSGFSFNKYSCCYKKYIDECIKNHTQIEKGKCPPDIPMYIENSVINQDKNLELLYKIKVKFPEIFQWL